MKKDTRPYIYAHELDGKWSLIYRENDRDETLVKGLDRVTAIRFVARQRKNKDAQ